MRSNLDSPNHFSTDAAGTLYRDSRVSPTDTLFTLTLPDSNDTDGRHRGMGSCSIMVKISLAPQGALGLAPGTRPELMRSAWRSVILCTSSLYCSGRRLGGAPFSITRSYCTTVFSRNDVLNMSVASCFQQSEAIRTVNLPFSRSLTHVGQLPSLIQIHMRFGS